MRKQLNKAVIESGVASLEECLYSRLKDKGLGVLSSTHEICGIVDEEVCGFKDSLRKKDYTEMEQKLMEIAVAALFGYICLINKTIDW